MSFAKVSCISSAPMVSLVVPKVLAVEIVHGDGLNEDGRRDIVEPRQI